MVALTTSSFMLLSQDAGSVFIGHLRLVDSVSLESCMLEGEQELTLTTRGVQTSADELLVRLESPVLTLTMVGRRRNPVLFDSSPNIGEDENMSAEEKAEAQALDSLMAPTRDISAARTWKFRPPAESVVWDVTIPPRIELIRQASFGEGSMTVEVCSSDDAFTNDGHEIDLPAPPSLWKGLFVETGVAIRKSNFPGNSSETLGMRWTSLPFKPRRGQEIESIGLREKLAAGQTNFTRSELDLFYQVVGEKKRALEVRDDSFIKVSESLYFQPDDTRDGPAPCGDFLSCANPELTAGEAVEVTLSEVVLSDDPGAPKRSFDDSKPVKGSRSSQLVFDSATTSFSTYGGEELDDLGERYTVENRLPPPFELGPNKLLGAPRVWLGRDLRWTLTRSPDDSPVVVESGEFKLDANFRFVMTTNRLTTVGLYEVEVQAPDGSPIDLLDYSFSIVKCLRFMVGPAQGSQLGAKISCADQVYNGSIFDVHVELQSCDAFGNPIDTDPGSCMLEVTSMRTKSTVARNPLQPSAGQAQIVQVCTIEPSSSGEQSWSQICAARDLNSSSLVSLLRVRVVQIDVLGEVNVVGELTKEVRVLNHPWERYLSAQQLDDNVLGLTYQRVSAHADFGSRAYSAAQKLRREVQAGLVQCVQASRRWTNPQDVSIAADEPALTPLTRYFHVVNVHVPKGDDDELIEYARTRRTPYYSHSPRLLPISSKFSPHVFDMKKSRWASIREGIESLVLSDAAVMIQKLWRQKEGKRIQTPQRLRNSARSSRTIAFFKEMTENEKALVIEALEEESFEVGSQVIRQGTYGDSIYIIKSGSVRVSVEIEGGEVKVVKDRLGPSDYFGEMALLNDQGFRSASIWTTSPTVLLSMTRAKFHELVGQERARQILENQAARRKLELQRLQESTPEVMNIAKTVEAEVMRISAAHLSAARAAVLKALNLKNVEIEFNKASYRTELVRSRSKHMPDLLSVYVVHHIDALVTPLSSRDFYVRVPAPQNCDSFFIWQPKRLVTELLSERQQFLADIVDEWEHGSSARKKPKEFDVRVATGDGEKIDLLNYIRTSKRFLARPGHTSVKSRMNVLRKLFEKLFKGANSINMTPMHYKLSVYRFLVTYSGSSVSGACILAIGTRDALRARARDFQQIRYESKARGGESSGQLVGLEEPVQGDEYFWGASAPIRGGLWEFPEFAHSAVTLALKPLHSTYATMLKGDPRRCVQHASMATASLSSIAADLQAEYKHWRLDNVAELSNLVAMSYREYDREFQKLEETDAASLERLLALPDDELWSRSGRMYPKKNGQMYLAQPDLGFNDTWMLKGHEWEANERFRNLMEQAEECQLQVKNRLLKAESPLSHEAMLARWPKMTYLGGWAMEAWGGGEAFDPGIKSGGRLQDKAMIKYKGDWSQMKDVSRFAIYYPDAQSLLSGLEKLKREFTCVKIENRFRRPTVLGWRDVTLLLEEMVETCGRKRHLVEVQLQLTGYANARKQAHHYYELVRKKIVADSGVTDTKEQEMLLSILLDAIEGASSKSSTKMLANNHRILQDVYSSCFGEIWAGVTCNAQRSIENVEEFKSGWCVATDLVDLTDLIVENDVEAMHQKTDLKLTSSTKQIPDGIQQQLREVEVRKHFEKVARCVLKAAEENFTIRAVLDSCLRKFKIGSFDTFDGGRDIKALALAILASKEMNDNWLLHENAKRGVLLGPCNDNLRLSDLLIDLQGNVWCSMLDGVSTRQCSMSPSVHELNITFGSIALMGVLDLLEAWELSCALADLDFGKCDEHSFGMGEVIQPPETVQGHRMRQAFLAAQTLRQYSWMYAGEQAMKDGGALDLLNLQHAGLLASRYILYPEFVAKSYMNAAWAFMAMLLNFDRASGESQADVAGLLLRLKDPDRHGARAKAKAYEAIMRLRAAIRPNRDTGIRPCDQPSAIDQTIYANSSPAIDGRAGGEDAKVLPDGSEDADAIEGVSSGRAVGAAGASEAAAISLANEGQSVTVPEPGIGELRLPTTECKRDPSAPPKPLQEDSFLRLEKQYLQTVRRDCQQVDAYYEKNELGKGTDSKTCQVMDLYIAVRPRLSKNADSDDTLGLPSGNTAVKGIEISDWLSQIMASERHDTSRSASPAESPAATRASASPAVPQIKKPNLIHVKGLGTNDLGTVTFDDVEQARLNRYLCLKISLLMAMARDDNEDSPNLICVHLHADDVEAKVRGPGDVLQAYWSAKFGHVDRRRRFLEDVQRRGKLMLMIEGLEKKHEMLGKYLANWCGAPVVVMLSTFKSTLPAALMKQDQGGHIKPFEVVHCGPPEFKLAKESAPNFRLICSCLNSIILSVNIDCVFNERHSSCMSVFIQCRPAGSTDPWVEERCDPTEMGRDADFNHDDTGDLLDSALNYEFSFSFEGLLPNTKYEVRIMGCNRLGFGQWSEVQAFSTAGKPPLLGEVGPVELLLERLFRPNAEHFRRFTHQSAAPNRAEETVDVTSRFGRGKTFDDYNRPEALLSCCAPVISFAESDGTRPVVPLYPSWDHLAQAAKIGDAKPSEEEESQGPWLPEHTGHSALMAASSVLGKNAGVKCVGPDMLLRNQAFMQTVDAPPGSDIHGRDGKHEPWVSYIEPGPRSSNHRIKHVAYSGLIMQKSVAAQLDNTGLVSGGGCHGQFISDPDDETPPVLFLALPIGCLIEEVILVKGEMPCEHLDVDQMTVTLYHLDSMKLRAARKAEDCKHFDALWKATFGNHKENPVWSGGVAKTGDYTGIANLSKIAAMKRDEIAKASSLEAGDVGGVMFGKGSVGHAHLPNDPDARVSGMIGNVIVIEPKGGASNTAIFGISGITLVGRRIKDPLKKSSISRKLNLARSRLFNAKLSRTAQGENEKQTSQESSDESKVQLSAQSE